MKKTIVTTAIIFTSFFGVSANGQNSEKFTGSLLWKISGNGLEQPSYIFGTHHLTGIEIIASVNYFYEAYNSCKQVVGEIDMGDPSIMAKTMRYSPMPKGYSYRELLTEDEYGLIDNAFLEVVGMGMAQLESMHPATLSSLYTISLYASMVPGFDITKFVPVDSYIQNIAREEGKPVYGLETIDFQLNVLYDTEPVETMVRQLLCAVSYKEQTVELLQKMNEDYATGNLYNLFELMNDESLPCGMSRSYLDALLDSRNEAWLQKLPGMFASEPTFVAVGAMHLAGEIGILAGLEGLGYTVTPVM